MPIWKTAKYSPKATPPRRAGTKANILSRWENRFPKSCWSICGCTILNCSLTKFKREDIRKYFPKSYTDKQVCDTVIKLLEQWQRRRERDRDSR